MKRRPSLTFTDADLKVAMSIEQPAKLRRFRLTPLGLRLQREPRRLRVPLATHNKQTRYNKLVQGASLVRLNQTDNATNYDNLNIQMRTTR